MQRPHDVILDFDDFGEAVSSLDLLYRMKARWPDFKVTLFTIPLRCSVPFLREIAKLDWIQLAIHGWDHGPVECETWTKGATITYLRHAFDWGVFVRGFKAPQWRLSQGLMEGLVEMGDFWLADNADPASNPMNVAKPESGLMYYYANGQEMIPGHSYGRFHREHGHIDCLQTNNDIRQVFHYLTEKFPEDTRFHFIDDIVRQTYATV